VDCVPTSTPDVRRDHCNTIRNSRNPPALQSQLLEGHIHVGVNWHDRL